MSLLFTYGVMTKKLSLNRMVDIFATGPAKMYGMYPRKGSILIGGDADIVIFDPDWKGTISVKDSQQGLDFNTFEGLIQNGRAEKVFLRGKLTVDDGRFVGEPSQGKFVKCEPYGLAYAGRHLK